ncbi:MAG: NADH dehydrogenase subunit 6 [Candidatus Obscuribacterales bacterium]|nr:NADH dehydrogenase subunit 6 [Candidatus Obscuribacterales bacterium]
MTDKRTAKKNRISCALIAFLLCLVPQLTTIAALAQTVPSPPGSQATGEQGPQGAARQTEATAKKRYYDSRGQMYQVPPATTQNDKNIDVDVKKIITGVPDAPLVFQAAEQGQDQIIRRAANNAMNDRGNVYNDTYLGLHQWFKDDLVGNLFTNIGQLIGKWMSEIIDGWIADTAQFLGRFLRVFVLNPNIATNGLNGSTDDGISRYVRQGADIMYGIAIDLLLLLFILCIWKFWAEAAWRGAGNLMAPVGRLIFTSGLMLAWPTLYAFEIQITNEMIKEIYFNSSDQVLMLEYALSSAVKGGVIAAGAGATAVFAPIMANMALPGAGAFVGSSFYFASLMIFIILGGMLIAELIYILVLKAIQTALLTAQYMFAPIFLVFFAIPDTENIATGFVRSFVETSLWTFVWVGLLKVMVIILFSDFNPWGKILISVGVLQLMIQVPSFLARAQISPMSDFITAGLITGGALKMLGGLGGALTSAVDKGVGWYTNDRFADRGLQMHKTTAMNGLPTQNANPQQLQALNQVNDDAARNALTQQVQNPGLAPPVRTPGGAAIPGTTGGPANPALNPPGVTTPGATAAGTQAGATTPTGNTPPTNPATNATAQANTAAPTAPNPTTGAVPPTLPVTPGTVAAVAGAAATTLANAQTAGLTQPATQQYKPPTSSIQNWQSTYLGNVPARQMVGSVIACETGVMFDENGTSLVGSTNGTSEIRLRKGATGTEMAHAIYSAGYANEIAHNDKARDAARQSVIEAGMNRPQGMMESMAANWLSNTGGSWNRTAMAKQRFQQSMYEQAALGAQAYLSNDNDHPNKNAYTNYLQNKYGEWNSMKDAMAEHIINNPNSSESAWNINRKAGFESCVQTGLAIGTDTIGAMQNFEVQKLHPFRRKEAALAALAYTAAAVNAQYPGNSDEAKQVRSLAHAEAARNLPADDVNKALAIYQTSGQADLNPTVMGAVGDLSAATVSPHNISYASMLTAAPHVARQMGRVSQTYAGGSASIADLQQHIVPAQGETQAQAMQQVIQVTSQALRAIHGNGIPIQTVMNNEVAPDLFEFLKADIGNAASPQAQRKMRVASTVMKTPGLNNNLETYNATLEYVNSGGPRPDADHINGAIVRINESRSSGQSIAHLNHVVEIDLANQAAGQASLPLDQVNQIAEAYAHGQARDYNQAPAIGKLISHGQQPSRRNIQFMVETMQDNGGQANMDHFNALVRISESTRDASGAAGVFEVMAREELRDRGVDPSQLNVNQMIGELANHNVTANDMASKVAHIQRSGGFSAAQMQDPQIVSVVLDQYDSASPQQMQAINVVSHMMGSSSISNGSGYVEVMTEFLGNSKPGSMRNVNGDTILAAKALNDAMSTYQPDPADQADFNNIKINSFTVGMTMRDPAWQNDHQQTSGKALIDAILDANRNRNRNNNNP